MSLAAVLRPSISQHPSHPPPPASSNSEGTSKADEVEPGVDISVLKELARRALVDALNSVRFSGVEAIKSQSYTLNEVNGAKTLVLDPSLAGPLGLVIEVALLKVGLGFPDHQ